MRDGWLKVGMAAYFSVEALAALVQVSMVDLVLAGDNAIVVGMAAAGLAPDLRRKAIVMGIGAAAILRILFAVLTTELLEIAGLTLAGGVLLLWVAWRMWADVRAPDAGGKHGQAIENRLDDCDGAPIQAPKTLGRSLIQIVVADVSMSLDNVLAVAGAARDHVAVMVVGLALSVIFMGIASTLIARLLAKHRWIAYVGLALIVSIAAHMLYDGADEVSGTLIGRGYR